MEEINAANAALSLAPTVIEAARLTIQGIDQKVRTAKASRDKDKVINDLESIINELINNQNELIRNQQVLENELSSQFISDDDLGYISNKLLPIISKLLLSNAKTAEEKATIEEQIQTMEALISTELLKVLQILGFSIKDAIGIPATKLVRTLIENLRENQIKQVDHEKLAFETQIKLIELSQDEESYKRYMNLVNSLM